MNSNTTIRCKGCDSLLLDLDIQNIPLGFVEDIKCLECKSKEDNLINNRNNESKKVK